MKKEKVTQLVLKLIKLTTNSELKWQSLSRPTSELPNGEILIDKMYTLNFNSANFRIYRSKSKYWVNEERFEWTTGITFELVDNNQISEYTFPYENSLNDLYEVVREQVSNVANVLDEILGSELEIISAEYFTPTISKDVAEVLRQRIVNNKLDIMANNELFGDPHHGVVKKLMIKYKYGDDVSMVEVQEGEEVKLP